MSQNLSASVAAPAARNPGWLRQLALVLGGTVALSASSYISIPFWPVPVTMQT